VIGYPGRKNEMEEIRMVVKTCIWHMEGNETLPHNYCSNPKVTKGYCICSIDTEKKCDLKEPLA
jgi:hypothetical protein